jgi:hypothetical protein
MGSSTQKRTFSIFLFVLSTHLALQVSNGNLTSRLAQSKSYAATIMGPRAPNSIRPLERENRSVDREANFCVQGGASNEIRCHSRRRKHCANRIISLICPFLPPRVSVKCPSIRKMVGRGGGDRTRPPNYKVPCNEGVAAACQTQLLMLLTERRDRHSQHSAVSSQPPEAIELLFRSSQNRA